VDFGLAAPALTAPLDDSVVPATPPFTPSPHSPRRMVDADAGANHSMDEPADRDVPPTQPWPVVLPEKEKVKDLLGDMCDPDLMFDDE